MTLLKFDNKMKAMKMIIITITIIIETTFTIITILMKIHQSKMIKITQIQTTKILTKLTL